MNKITAKTTEIPELNTARLAGIASLVSLFSFFYYFQHNGLLLYGDAVAHINIARRVFDSQTPGPLALGTVWLPLPHLLMIPFIFFDGLWKNGAGGSIPSMAAYVFGVIGIFRLVHGSLEADRRTKPASAVGAWAAAFAYGANPNLIYMQVTAMTESIYLVFFVWSVVYFAEFVRSLQGTAAGTNDDAIKPQNHVSGASLYRCGGCLAAAELTRYDGWFLAGAIGATVIIVGLRRWDDHVLRTLAAKFLLGISLAPVLWLVYNGVVYGNALEFANGPYSAKAIQLRMGAPNPAFHNVAVAAIYFLKSAQLNMAEGNWGRFWLLAALLASAIVGWKMRLECLTMLLLWVPLVFYSLSIAYGSVPVHVYTWWPFATFNQRYGLQFLPMFAVSSGTLTAFVFLLSQAQRHAGKLTALLFALVVISYASVWKVEPECLKEAKRNFEIRNPLNSAVARVVATLPRNARFLMDLGEHVGIMQQLGIPLRRVVNNENHRAWKRPTDPEGLWERALANPPEYVDFVIAFDGDLVDRAVNRNDLIELTEIHATGQPRAHIYAARNLSNQSH
jgi:hypothetical protein